MKFTSLKTTDGNKPFLFNELRNGVYFAYVKSLVKKNVKRFITNLQEPTGQAGSVAATFSKHFDNCILTMKWQSGETLQFLISDTVDLNQFFYQNQQLVEVRNLFEKAQEVAGLDSKLGKEMLRKMRNE